MFNGEVNDVMFYRKLLFNLMWPPQGSQGWKLLLGPHWAHSTCQIPYSFNDQIINADTKLSSETFMLVFCLEQFCELVNVLNMSDTVCQKNPSFIEGNSCQMLLYYCFKKDKSYISTCLCWLNTSNVYWCLINQTWKQI